MADAWFVLGYLGSGKTTFVKDFLARHPGRNAVLVNDFGAEDVDGVILEHSAVKVESIFDGSVFCTCRSEKFTEAMIALSEEGYDRVIVETSGLANPFQMRKILSFINTRAKVPYRMRGAVCIVDARNAEKVLYSLNSVKMQIAAADVILINKTDLSDKTSLLRLENAVRAFNADAPLYFTTGARLPDENFEVKERTLPAQLEDITIQKAKAEFADVLPENVLCALGRELSEFCHRIKGIVRRENEYTVFEFADGTAHWEKTDKEGNFLILLGAGKFSLRERAEQVLKESGVAFRLC